MVKIGRTMLDKNKRQGRTQLLSIVYQQKVSRPKMTRPISAAAYTIARRAAAYGSFKCFLTENTV